MYSKFDHLIKRLPLLFTILFIILIIAAIFSGGNDKRIRPLQAKQARDRSSVQNSPGDLQNALNSAAQSVEPATVSIKVIRTNHLPQSQPQYFWQNGRINIASGFIFDPQGLVLTNYHTIKNARDIYITLPGKGKFYYPAQILAVNPQIDLAVLKIFNDRRSRFNACLLGDSDNLRVGDMVLSIGSPYGLNHSVSYGIVSDIRPFVNIEGRVYRGLIQTDAAINHGSSGGPLVNLEGQVVGINSALFSPSSGFSGVGFAIPINQARAFIKRIGRGL